MAAAKQALQVESCAGQTATARLAQDVAARLARLADLPTVDAGAIVIDGCRSACAQRRLEGRGVRTAAIQLQELGVDPDTDVRRVDTGRLTARAVERVRALAEESSRPARAGRPSPGPAAGSDRRSAHSSGDYLYALHTLTSPVVSCGVRTTDLPTLAAHVARMLDVSRASAGEMIERLGADGLIEHGPRKEILLTVAGHEAAAEIVRRHRLVERLLTDLLGYTVAESYPAALQMRSGCTDTLIERIAERLAPPARCPHGWPIDLAEEHDEVARLVTLTALARGETATVVALLESDAATLAHLTALGIEPGAEARVLDATADRITVDVDGRLRTLNRNAGSTVFVRPR